MHPNRRLTVFLGACALVFATYWLVPDRLSAALYDGLGALAGLALLAAARGRDPGARAPWYLLGAGTLLWAGGDTAWSVYEYIGHPAPYPSIADAAYLLAYPLWIVGVLMLARGRGKRPDATIAIDALIATVAGGIITWLVIVRPQIADLHASALPVAVTIAYPIMDVLLLGAAVGALLTPRRHDRAFALLIVGLVATLIADNAYSIAVLNGTYTQHSWMNAGWLIFYATWGAAALLRTPEPGGDGATEPSRPRNWVSLVSFAMAAAAFPVVYLTVGFDDDHAGMILVFVASVPVIALIGVRQWITMRRGDQDRLRIEHQRELLERTLDDLSAVQRERSDLLDRTVRAAEEERARVAVELHDGPIQHLAALSFRLGVARSKLKVADVEATDHLLALAECELSDDISELRRLMSDLRPPALDEGGLEGALRDHCDIVAVRTSADVRLRYGLSVDLPHDTEIVLYRIAQEALSNVARHAHAASVDVDVDVDGTSDGAVLSIHDDGGGFDAGETDAFTRDGHFGLAGMAQRASMVGGRFSVESAAGGGTTVTAWVPWASA